MAPVTETASRLATIETKVDGIEKAAEKQTESLAKVADSLHQLALRMALVDDHAKKLDHLETKVSGLEKHMYRIAGAGIVVGFLAQHADKVFALIK
jgi:DNA repair ATPase RecN